MRILLAVLKDFIIFFNTKTKQGKRRILALLGVAVAIFFGIKFFGADSAPLNEASATKPEVTVRSVSELASSASFDTVGKVEAVSEANLQTEAGGRITAVNVKVGDTVAAGSVLATIENSAQRAALLQAQGSYEAALAAAAQSSISRGESGTAVTSAKSSLVNAIRGGYNNSNTVVISNIDTFFSSPDSYVPGLKINSKGDAGLFNSERVAYQSILPEWSARVNSLTPDSNLAAEAAYAKENINRTIAFCDMFIQLFSEHDGSNAYTDEELKTNVQTFSTLKAGLIQNLSAIEAAEAQLKNANDAATRTSLSATGGSASAVDAQVKIALGSLQAAQASYQKTIVRSPIQGVVNALYLKTGDYASPGQPAGIVANNNGLQIKTFVNEVDSANLNVGDAVTLEGGASGVITAKAEALDPSNGKVAIVIGVNPDSKLTNGATVKVTFSQVSQAAVSDKILVPLSALKITPDGTFVFTVNQEGALVSVPVKQGQLYGDTVEILEGVTKETRIVTDARGLKEGQSVTIK
ncbi:MAG: hypothetical protein RL538_296 [Candidatus Parcubacteria bacterium]|jgi:multidrug efflux pump subunit AcrA (membrane-fusion protein)